MNVPHVNESIIKTTPIISVLGFGVLSVLLSFFIATLKGTVVQVSYEMH